MKTRECDVGGAVRLPKQFYERPLTLEESRFASEHISIVYRYLRQQGLNSDEWFDVVIFRYLLSVKRYFAVAAIYPSDTAVVVRTPLHEADLPVA